jgi:hypothetical protein
VGLTALNGRVHQATMTNLAIAANGVFLGVVFVTGCGP